jgi:hypothetical protein
MADWITGTPFLQRFVALGARQQRLDPCVWNHPFGPNRATVTPGEWLACRLMGDARKWQTCACQ